MTEPRDTRLFIKATTAALAFGVACLILLARLIAWTVGV